MSVCVRVRVVPAHGTCGRTCQCAARCVQSRCCPLPSGVLCAPREKDDKMRVSIEPCSPASISTRVGCVVLSATLAHDVCSLALLSTGLSSFVCSPSSCHVFCVTCWQYTYDHTRVRTHALANVSHGCRKWGPSPSPLFVRQTDKKCPFTIPPPDDNDGTRLCFFFFVLITAQTQRTLIDIDRSPLVSCISSNNS